MVMRLILTLMKTPETEVKLMQKLLVSGFDFYTRIVSGALDTDELIYEQVVKDLLDLLPTLVFIGEKQIKLARLHNPTKVLNCAKFNMIFEIENFLPEVMKGHVVGRYFKVSQM